MATIAPGILTNRPNIDGSYNIKIIISSASSARAIKTNFKIASLSEWKNGRVCGRPDADFINAKLLGLCNQYLEIIEEMPFGEYSAAEVKDFIVAKLNRRTDIKGFVENFIKELMANGQKSYGNGMRYTLRYLLECFGENVSFEEINYSAIVRWEKWLFKQGNSSTTVNIRMTHLKAVLNNAVNNGVVEYKIFPFRQYRMPQKAIRDICISKEELTKLREADFEGTTATKRLTVARDLFLLSFYCGGINLTDLVDADFTKDILTFIRKKTADKKSGEKKVSITIQPEARTIIDKYLTNEGKLDFGYHYSDYRQFSSFVTKSLNRIGEMLEFEKKLMFYSARKTFCQFGYELGIPLYVLEYAIGQTIKDANNRPIFNYIKIMRKQADAAIRSIIDFSLSDEEE